MSLLLIPGKVRTFNPDLAIIVGIQEAVFLQQVFYHCDGAPREPDGFQWWRASFETVATEICCSVRTAKTVVGGLKSRELVIVASCEGTDRRNRYRVNFDSLFKLHPIPDTDFTRSIERNRLFDGTKSADPSCNSCTVDSATLAPSRAHDPYPDSKSTQKTHTHGATSAPSEKPQRVPKQAPPEIEPHWSEFVAAYPPRDGNLCRSEGQRIFARLAAKGEDLAAIVRGARGYRRHCDDKGSTGGPYVKQIPSFLNGRCWEEWMQAATRGVTQQTRIGGPINERQLAKDREAAIRKAAIFGCSVGEIDKRFADE